MNKKVLDFMDKVDLRKREIIESVDDLLKNIRQIEHFRHRSFDNFIGNLISGINCILFF